VLEVLLPAAAESAPRLAMALQMPPAHLAEQYLAPGFGLIHL